MPGPFPLIFRRPPFPSARIGESGLWVQGEVKKVNIYFWPHRTSTRFVCRIVCVLCIRRRIDFSPRVDASGGADGLRTTVVVVVVVVTLAHVGDGRGGIGMGKDGVLET